MERQVPLPLVLAGLVALLVYLFVPSSAGNTGVDRAIERACSELGIPCPSVSWVYSIPSICSPTPDTVGCSDGRSVWVRRDLSPYLLASTAVHEIRHVWQYRTGFTMDGEHVPYTQRRQERDADAYARAFMTRVTR